MNWKYLLIVVLIGATISLAMIVVVLLIGLYVVAQSPASGPLVSFPVSVPTPSTTQVITSTLSYGDALSTYEKTAASAIHAAERAVDSTKWLVGLILGLATLASAVAGYLYKTAREAGRKAALAQAGARAAEEAAAKAQDAADQAKGRVDVLSAAYQRLSDDYRQLERKTHSIDDAIQAYERKEISIDEYIARQQWFYWTTFKHRQDDISWYGLQELLSYGDRLPPDLRADILVELQKTLDKGDPTTDQQKHYEERLHALLAGSRAKRTHDGDTGNDKTHTMGRR